MLGGRPGPMVALELVLARKASAVARYSGTRSIWPVSSAGHDDLAGAQAGVALDGVAVGFEHWAYSSMQDLLSSKLNDATLTMGLGPPAAAAGLAAADGLAARARGWVSRRARRGRPRRLPKGSRPDWRLGWPRGSPRGPGWPRDWPRRRRRRARARSWGLARHPSGRHSASSANAVAPAASRRNTPHWVYSFRGSSRSRAEMLRVIRHIRACSLHSNRPGVNCNPRARASSQAASAPAPRRAAIRDLAAAPPGADLARSSTARPPRTPTSTRSTARRRARRPRKAAGIPAAPGRRRYTGRGRRRPPAPRASPSPRSPPPRCGCRR